MQLGIFAKTFDGTNPEHVWIAAKHAGYETVQYNFACSGLGSLPTRISDFDIERIRRAKIPIAAISATYNMIDPVAQRREAGRKAFAAIAVAAQKLGVGIVTVCTGSRDEKDQWKHHPDNASAEAWSDMIEEFEILIPIASETGIKIGIEPEEGNVVSSATKAKRLLSAFNSHRLGIVFDAANIATSFETATNLLSGNIILAHAKDRTADGRFVAAGKGAIDWPHYIRCLKTAGFDGPLITHGLGAEEAPQVAKFLKELL